MPSGFVEHEDSMTSWLDVLCDFVQMQLHRLDVAPGQDQADGLALLRANRAKDIGRGRARRSLGAEGRVPRLAQRRVILFFCPMRASSANQISMPSMPTPFSRAISSRRAGKLYGMARPSFRRRRLAGESGGGRDGYLCAWR
jgi:hypothetical protein